MKEKIADWIPALTEEYRLEAANEILSLIRTEIEKAKLTPQEIDEAYVNGKLPKRAIDIVTCRRRNIAQDQLNKILKLLED